MQAATIIVTSGADAGAGSLRQAIADAVAGDDIAFSGVTTINLTSAELVINKNLIINGGTGVTITRSGATEFRIFRIWGATTTVVFNKLSITNGKDISQAGGIENNSILTLNDCIIANNAAGQGSGIQNNGTMTMNRCFVHSNTLTAGGGGSGLIIYSSSTTTLNNCVFTNNQLGYAIDMPSAATLTITNCTIAQNAGGIAINNSSAIVTLKNTIVAENTATSNANIRNNNVSASSAYNLIGTEGGNGGLTNGTNNNLVGISPQFANSSDPDGADNRFGTSDDGLMLSACNLATNVGNNADAPSGTDIVGNTRIFNTTVDIGAYEFQANSTPSPTITLGTIPAILAGATTFTLPYSATTSSPTTYSISGIGITTATNAALPSSPITVNLNPAASGGTIDFTLTVKNANGCASMATRGRVMVYTPMTQVCAMATFNGTAPIAPTATTAGVGGKGGIYTYTVPTGVTAIHIDAKGAKGGSSPITGGGTFSGGQGGRVQATYAVTSGEVLYILVGGKGGDGSLDNGVNNRTASGGGGATVVSKGVIGSGTLLLVAGGGGGAGHSGIGGNSNNASNSGAGANGGGGASFSANGGNSTSIDNCGQGGQALTAGGNGGANTCFRPETNGGGYGGGGAGNYSIPNGTAGGGGGGGYVGGNAGFVAGGNGGSNYNDPNATNVTISNHTDDNGSVTLYAVAGTHPMTWNGSVSTNWNTPCNWTPNGIPSATNPVTIANVPNKPVILSGTTAACYSIDIEGAATLTINIGSTLTVSPTNATVRDKGINVFSNATLTNNGTINATTTANINLIVLNDNTTFNNNGTVNLNTPTDGIQIGGANAKLNNNVTGTINFQTNLGIRSFGGQAGSSISNQGMMNFTGNNYFITTANNGLIINNSGTFDIKSGSGIIVAASTLNNLDCGKILMPTTTYENSVTNSTTTNAGLIIANRIVNSMGGNFTNAGVLKYNTLTGTITNSTNSVVVNNTTPIFTYGSTYNGTINGIFTDSLATISAGTFTAPNAFTPLGTLPSGVQTLYAKITPRGGACTYIVPFSYNTKSYAQEVVLHQNRPNPFSKTTTISFDLIETEKAVLTVFDVSGRQIFVADKTFNAGYNEVILDKSVFYASGTYFYRLTSDKYALVKKLQFIGE